MKSASRRVGAILAVGLACFTSPALAQSGEVKIGMITTLSGPGSGLGIDVRDAFALALKDLGGSLGGLKATVIEADDQQKPDVAKQLADRMVERDKVDVVTGIIWSNLALALMPSLERAEVFFLSPNAGPSQLAGKQCNPFFFGVAYQNDGQHEAMGQHMQFQGIKPGATHEMGGRDLTV
jgi:branched-chain amino acid transport system substrate-binding protein